MRFEQSKGQSWCWQMEKYPVCYLRDAMRLVVKLLAGLLDAMMRVKLHAGLLLDAKTQKVMLPSDLLPDAKKLEVMLPSDLVAKCEM